MNNTLGIAAMLCRVSTHDQRELSLDSQEEAVRRVLEDLGYEVPDWAVIKIDWSSLDLMSSPDFQRLRGWILSGSLKAIGVLDRDRLQAQGLQRLIFLSECRENGVRLITVQGPPMLEEAEGQLVELALALGKERSVLRAQQGARDGLRDRARLKGLPPNMAKPYGMRWENDRLLPDENYEIVCEIWRMALSGSKIRTIAMELTRRGVPTPSGRVSWSPYTVRHILKSRTYAGVIEALKTEAVEPKRRRKATYGKSGKQMRAEDERVLLKGLVERPVLTEAEFEWMQRRLKENQRLAQKNARLRFYLLRGLVACAGCGRTYIGVTRKNHSYYYCGARWKPNPGDERCRSKGYPAHAIEEAVFRTVSSFLGGSEAFEAEMRRRADLSEYSIESLRRDLADLERQDRGEEEAEARAFRLGTRARVSEEVFNREMDQIRARQKWICEERERVKRQLEDLECHTMDPEAVALLRRRLEGRLRSATPEDRRFVLEALGTRIIAQPDGDWELEIQVPRDQSEPVQIVSSRPGSNYTWNTESRFCWRLPETPVRSVLAARFSKEDFHERSVRSRQPIVSSPCNLT